MMDRIRRKRTESAFLDNAIERLGHPDSSQSH